jgi:error-prone DNA polymerase
LFVELHARSAFSFLEGSSLPEELVGVCQHFQMPAMALLDTDGLYGAPRFHLAANKIGLKAHIGAEVSAPLISLQRHRATENINQQSTINNQNLPLCPSGEFRLPLLVTNRTGYQNLCRLITKMKLRAKKGEGAVTAEELEEHAEGLICLTGGDEGPLAAALARGGPEKRISRSMHSSASSGPTMFMSNCNATSIAKKNPATASASNSPAPSISRCSQPTA